MTEMDPHVQNALYGTPKLNPDEQRHYLGNFRERVCALQMKATPLNQAMQKAWQAALAQYPSATLYLNGQLPDEELTTFMQLANQAKRPFTLVEDPAYAKATVAAVLVAPTAVHVKAVDLAEQVKSVETDEQAKSETRPWYKRLFDA